MLQRLELIGSLGADSEVKDFNNNQVINFSIACTEKFTDKNTNEKREVTTWYDCSKWGNNASIAQYLKKGALVRLVGKPTARSYQKNDGTTATVIGINIHELNILKFAGDGQNNSAQAPAARPQANQTNSFADSPSDFKEEDHDDLPF